MKSIKFPEMFNNTSTNVVVDRDATLQNMKLLFWSEKGELFGDPYYGTTLRKYLYSQNDNILKDILVDDIYTALTLFIPQIKVDRKDITIVSDNKGVVSASIVAKNMLDFKTDLYNIVLLDTEA